MRRKLVAVALLAGTLGVFTAVPAGASHTGCTYWGNGTATCCRYNAGHTWKTCWFINIIPPY